MMKHLEVLQVILQPTGVSQTVHNHDPSQCHWSNNRVRCAQMIDSDHCAWWKCGEFGNLQPDCPQQILWQASSIYVQLAKEVINIYQPTHATSNVNAIFYADILVGKVPTNILL